MKARILIIHHNAEIIRALSSKLQGRGYDVKSCSTAEGGLNLTRQIHPDLIIIDPLFSLNDYSKIFENEDPDLLETPVIMLSADAKDKELFWVWS